MMDLDELLIKSLSGDRIALDKVAELYCKEIHGSPTKIEMDYYEKIYSFYVKNSENSYSQYQLGMMFRFGSLTLKNMGDAIEWLEFSVEQKNPLAMCALAEIYKNYRPPENKKDKKDKNKIFSLYKQASELGNNEGHYQVGMFLLKEDDKDCIKYLTLAALENHQLAQIELGYCYLNGIVIAKNITEGKKWLEKCDHDIAQYYLGEMCFSDGDYLQALKWFKLSAKANNSHAELKLGIIYSHGLGVKKSLTVAKKWFDISATHGNDQALGHYDEINNSIKCIIL